MAVPYEYPYVVEHVGPRLRIVGDENATRANSFAAVNDACVGIRRKDRNWGLLIKQGGANVMERAADIWLYNLGNGTAQVVDIVTNAEGFGGDAPGTSWQEKDIRSMSEWAEPFSDTVGPGPEPIPDSNSVLVPTMAALEGIVQAIGALQLQIDDLRNQIASQPPAPSFPSKIALRAWTGNYLVSEGDGAVRADRPDAGPWETWGVEPK